MSAWRLLLAALLAGLVAASYGSAQQGTVNVKSIFDTSNVQVQPGDAGNNAIRVNVVAGGGAGGTSSNFGAAFPGTGTAAGARDTNGDMQPFSLDGAGTGQNLKVNCAAGCSGGPTDESAFTFGASSIFTGGVFQTTATANALNNLQAGVVQMTAQRAFFVNPRNSSGTEIATQTNPYRIDPTGTTAQPVKPDASIWTLTGTSANVAVTNTPTVTASQSGTWTVQPGNTANSTAWLVTGTGGTFPVTCANCSGTVTVSGTVTATQSASNWQTDVRMFGGVNLSTGTGAGGAGIPRVTISNDSSLAANQSVNVAQINGVTPLMGNGSTGTGSQRVTIASDNTAFGVNAAQSGTWTVQPGNTPNTTAWLIQPVAGTTGGASNYRAVSTAGTNAANVKASAGTVYGFAAGNINAAVRYVHLYNTAGTPTCGASIIGTWIVPGNTAGAGSNVSVPVGVAFGTGIGVCITTAMDGTGSVSASDVVLNIQYK